MEVVSAAQRHSVQYQPITPGWERGGSICVCQMSSGDRRGVNPVARVVMEGDRSRWMPQGGSVREVSAIELAKNPFKNQGDRRIPLGDYSRSLLTKMNCEGLSRLRVLGSGVKNYSPARTYTIAHLVYAAQPWPRHQQMRARISSCGGLPMPVKRSVRPYEGFIFASLSMHCRARREAQRQRGAATGSEKLARIGMPPARLCPTNSRWDNALTNANTHSELRWSLEDVILDKRHPRPVRTMA